MIKPQRIFLILSFAIFLPFSIHAEAPVYDDSENFAMLDDQQAAEEQPIAREAPGDLSENYEETPLANETMDSISQSDNAMLLDKLQGLKQEVQELRGQLEVQAHDLKVLQQQQLAFYKDLDARLQRSSSTTAKKETSPDLKKEPSTDISMGTAAPAKPAPPAASPAIASSKPKTQPTSSGRGNPAEEQISYLAAYELIKNKKYDEALEAMQNFVTQYPLGGYTANAQYWLGELYMVKKNYPQAMEHFNVVLQQFPSSSKSAASMVKIGYALAASGKPEEAKMRLQQVIKTYPDTNTAQLAITKLDSINS